jgi:hypothetical protein
MVNRVLIVGSGYYSSKFIKRRLLKRKIHGMRIESKVLLGLMKKAQTERFKENKISGLVYNIRIKKYEERLGIIKEDLPILEARLSGKKTKKHS